MVCRAVVRAGPWPAALVLREVFATSGAKLAAALEMHGPATVLGIINERYGAGRDMLLYDGQTYAAAAPGSRYSARPARISSSPSDIR